MLSASSAIGELFHSELDRNIIELVLYDHRGNQFDLIGRARPSELITNDDYWRHDSAVPRNRRSSNIDTSEMIGEIIRHHHQGRLVDGNYERDNTYAIWSDDGDFGYGILTVVDVTSISSMARYAKFVIFLMLSAFLMVSLVVLFLIKRARKVYREKTKEYLNELKNNIDSRTDRLYAIQRQLNETNQRLRQRVDVDSLTGIATRGGFFSRAEQFWEAVETNNASILMIDVDNFKGINDTYGHLVGDLCLEKASTVISEISDAEECIKSFGRYGGEEFIMLCTNVSPVGAFELGETIRKKIAQEKLPVSYNNATIEIELRVSIGIGFTSTPDKTPMRIIIDESDKALYSAKRRGRNRTIIHKNSLRPNRLHG